MRHRFSGLFALAGLLIACATPTVTPMRNRADVRRSHDLHSAPPTSREFGPSATLHGKLAAIVEVLGTERTAERDAQVAALADSIFDYDALTSRLLGTCLGHYRADERDAFQEVLVALLRNTSHKSVVKTLGYDVTFSDERARQDGTVAVEVMVANKTESHEHVRTVVFVMHEVHGRWLIEDVETDGDSLVARYRSLFARVIRRHGLEDLVGRMNRVAERRP